MFLQVPIHAQFVSDSHSEQNDKFLKNGVSFKIAAMYSRIMIGAVQSGVFEPKMATCGCCNAQIKFMLPESFPTSNLAFAKIASNSEIEVFPQ